ncbi:MAG: hypothetical protein M9938_09935 [Solirubrobacterales bacterium]|nr:hypothetical protein [Solirubrobacterales bacterium]
MSRLSSRFSVVLGTTLCLGALAVVGCGGSSSPAASADATCADFGKMSDEDQRSTAQLVLEANNVPTDGLGAGVKIDGAVLTLKAYCKVSGDTATVNNVTDIGDAARSFQQGVENSSGNGSSAK